MPDNDVAAQIPTHRAYLLRVAMLQLRNNEAAEDVVQDTLIAALQGAAGFSGRSSVKTWLTGILKHKIVDAIRRKTREPAFAQLDDECQIEDFDALFDASGHWETLRRTGAIRKTTCRDSSFSTSCSFAWKSCRPIPPGCS